MAERVGFEPMIAPSRRSELEEGVVFSELEVLNLDLLAIVARNGAVFGIGGF